MSLLHDIHCAHGREEAQTMVAAFQRLQLPIPEAQEYITTSDKGYMMFLEPYGTTIRLIHDEAFPTLRSDHVLQPLGTLPLKKFRLDINPGLATALNEDDTDDLVDLLRYEKIDYFDNGTSNVGWLPYVTKNFPDGYPVVIDLGAVKRLTLGVHHARGNIRYKGIQEKIYGDLKESFAQAIQTNSSGAMRDFWAACRDKTDKGILYASWTWKEARNICNVSSNYAGRLTAFAPV